MTATSGSRFVGRTPERNTLLEIFDQVRTGPSALLVITGEAGFGKTALLDAARTTSDLSVLHGGCDAPTGSTASPPYGPFVEALRRIRKGAPAYESARNWLHPRTGESAHPADNRRNDLLDILEELAGERPYVLVLEDLQWADHSSLDLLQFVARNLPAERLAIVVTTRPVSQLRDPDRAAALDNLRRLPDCRWLDLEPMPDDDVAALARLWGATASQAVAIARKCGGSPLYAKELAEASSRGGTVTVPASVQEGVLARLAALPPEASEVLDLAAVIGEDFDVALVREVLAAHRETATVDLDAVIADALKERLLERDGTAYRFRHELERQAVYDAILPGRREQWHERVAAWLQATSGAVASAQQCARIAAHWEKSGNRPEAAAAMLRAGYAAYEVSAFPEALDDLVDGLDRWRSLPTDPPGWAGDRTEAATKAAASARWTGRLADGLAILRSALPVADPGTTVRLWERIGRYEHEQGNGDAALQAYQNALGVPEADAPHSDWAEVHAGFARLLMLHQKYAEAREHSELALQEAGALPSAARAKALNTLGVITFLAGEKDHGLDLLEESGRMALEVPSAEDFWRYVGNLTYCLLNAGRVTECVTRAFQEWDRARAADIHRSVAVLPSLNNALIGLMMLGRWTEAIERVTDALAHKPSPGQAASLHIVLAELYALRGDRTAANEELGTAEPQATGSTEPKVLADLWRVRAELSAQRLDIEEVRGHVAHGHAALSRGDDPDSRLQLLDVALRAEADARGRRNASTEQVRTLADEVGELAPAQEGVWPLTEALVATCRAEAERARHKNPADWHRVAELWDAVQNPYRAAYARMREAEALPAQQSRAAARALGWAADAAARLGASPLLETITAIAERRRIELAPPPAPAPRPRAATQYRLTPREISVVRQLVGGASAYEIGNALGVATRTATTHLQNIYKKLNVGNRETAVALVRAQRLLENA